MQKVVDGFNFETMQAAEKELLAGKRFCGFKSRCEYCTFIKKNLAETGKLFIFAPVLQMRK